MKNKRSLTSKKSIVDFQIELQRLKNHIKFSMIISSQIEKKSDF